MIAASDQVLQGLYEGLFFKKKIRMNASINK